MATVFKRNDKDTGKPKRGAKWIIRYKDEKGLWKDKSSGTSCKQTAQAQANQLEAEATKQRSGLIDSKLQGLQKEARRPIQEHVDAFQKKMKNAGTGQKHVAEESIDSERIYQIRKSEIDRSNRTRFSTRIPNFFERAGAIKSNIGKTSCLFANFF